MKIKTYRAKGYMRLILSIRIKDTNRTIHFGGATYTEPRSYACFITGDEELQAALEKSPAFGKSFVLEDTRYNKEVAPPKPVDKVLEFNNFNELRDYLIKEHGKAPISVATLTKAEAQMAKLGLEYTLK